MIMKKKFTIILAFAFFLSGSYSFAQGVNYYGTSVANFLKIGMGAKNMGIAEADVTSSQDAAGLYWNPGAISRNTHSSASFSYIKWLVDSYLSYLAVSLPTEFGTVGLDVSYFGSGDMEETTLQKQDGTGRTITASDMALGLALAKNLTDRFSVGVKVKYIRETLASVNADAFAFDIGTVFKTSFLNEMKLGIVLSNFGSSMQFTGNDLLVSHVVPGSPTNKEVPAALVTDSWNIPMFFKIGLATDAYKSEKFRWSVYYTLTDSRDYQPRHNIGSEVSWLNMVTLRGGYKVNYDETKFAAGIGFRFATEIIGDVMFDYAYTDFGILKDVHQISISLDF